jgi:hypothetical protein
MKVNRLRKLFDVITAGEAPADVDAAAHRSALWTAFVTSGVVFTACFVASLLLILYFMQVLDPDYSVTNTSWFNSLAFLQLILGLCQPSLIFAFIIPFLVYAIALTWKGYRIPLSIANLMAAAFGAYVFAHLLPHRLWNTEVEYVLLAVALILQRQLTSDRARKIAIRSFIWITIIYIVSYITIYVTANGIMLFGLEVISIDKELLLNGGIFPLLLLPVMILLPIGLMASPQSAYAYLKPTLTKPTTIFGSVVISAFLLAAIYAVIKYLEMTMPNGLPWFYTMVIDYASHSVWIMLFAVYLFAYFSRRSSRELLVFLIIVPVVTLAVQRLIEASWMGEKWIGVALAIGGLAALALSAEGKFRGGKLRAAGIILFGSSLVWLYCRLVLPHIAEQFQVTMLSPASSPLAMALFARVALLLFIPAVLFAAWWFISPKEIESLVLGKEEPTTRQRDGDGSLIP